MSSNRGPVELESQKMFKTSLEENLSIMIGKKIRVYSVAMESY